MKNKNVVNGSAELKAAEKSLAKSARHFSGLSSACHPKVFVKTFGCQMNQRDSEVVKGLLGAEGYKFAEDEKSADIVLFNTCSVRQHAEDKVWSALGKFKTRRTRNSSTRKTVLGVIGCMAQNYKDEIFKRAPMVDIVCGPSSIGNIALYLEEALRKKHNVLGVTIKNRKDAIYHTGFYEDKKHAYVVISEGCDNFCSYCVVPFVRGRLRHRPLQDIVREVQEAIDCGIENITLLGQNVNSYKSIARPRSSALPGIDFVELLKKVSPVKGLKTLSFITSHPKNISKELFELMADTPVIKKCLHLPLQAGSDRILKLMNRGYTAKRYLEIVDQYRALVYNGDLSTDFIIGFPTETEEDFQKTFDLAKRVRFDSAYIFKYSPRPHTKATLLTDDVPLAVKKRRHAELLRLQKEISDELSKKTC